MHRHTYQRPPIQRHSTPVFCPHESTVQTLAMNAINLYGATNALEFARRRMQYQPSYKAIYREIKKQIKH